MERTNARPWWVSLCLMSLASCSSYELEAENDTDPSSGDLDGSMSPEGQDDEPGDGDGDGEGSGDGDGDGDPPNKADAGGGNTPGDGDGDGDGESDLALLVGAGDIASCESDGDEQTADLLDSMEGTIFLAGDIAYDDGTAKEFAECFDPSWGRHRARMRPAAGNHEYYNGDEGDAAPYFDYFGEAAGEKGKGWYSYDLGAWHVVVLNSNCDPEEPHVACEAGSEQEAWLRADLLAHPSACTLAYYHHPLFSSGDHGNNIWMKPLWETLHAGGVDLILSGHDHHYERFAGQDAEGNADPRGIRSFIVGTGGRGHYDIVEVQPNSELQDASTFGLLELSLRPSSYDYRFVPVSGSTFSDEGTADCDNDRTLTP